MKELISMQGCQIFNRDVKPMMVGPPESTGAILGTPVCKHGERVDDG
jgi:hypothetical protein